MNRIALSLASFPLLSFMFLAPSGSRDLVAFAIALALVATFACRLVKFPRV